MATTYKLQHPRSSTQITVSSAGRRDKLIARGYTEVKEAAPAKAKATKKAKE